jgi:predicted MFS family arabinose efflux permease
MSQCANNQNVGLFNSVFWTFVAATLVVGNICGAFVINKVDASTFFLIATSVCLASVFVYIPLATPKKADTDTYKCAEPEGNQVSETWKLAKSTRMMVFIPLLAQSGVIMAFRSALLMQMFAFTMDKTAMTPSTQNSQILLACLGLGFGQVAGTLINGQLRDKIGTRQVVYVNMLQHVCAYVLILRYLSVASFSLTFAL